MISHDKWREEKPTETGYYWLKRAKYRQPELVYVFEVEPDGINAAYYTEIGRNRGGRDKGLCGTEASAHFWMECDPDPLLVASLMVAGMLRPRFQPHPDIEKDMFRSPGGDEGAFTRLFRIIKERHDKP